VRSSVEGVGLVVEVVMGLEEKVEEWGRNKGGGRRTSEVDELLGGGVEVLGKVVEADNAGDADAEVQMDWLV